MKKFILILSLFGNSALAFNFEKCKVIEIVQNPETQNAHVALSCNINNRPNCATATNFFAFDKSTSDGKTMLATVLTAFVTESNVTGHISQSCPDWQPNVAWLAHLRLSR